MKKLFYIGLLGFALFEVANVYFIMPMPGSQRMESLDWAYFLHQWRWAFRAVFIATALVGARAAFQNLRWQPLAAVAVAAGIAFMFNREMAADQMFLQPGKLSFADSTANKIALDKLVIGLEIGGQAKAYPIQLIGYHHQVRDTLGGQAIMVTYCTVCRTGRAFLPTVNGQPETFRLVGMDHFNAMFEDATTGSWWRQATGEAVAGPLRGAQLPELHTTQMSLREWFALHQGALVMQPDSTFSEEYTDMDTYDTGTGRGELTGTDTTSWGGKSWVIGLRVGSEAKAFDWNRLKNERIIHDQVGNKAVVLALAADGKSFFAFEWPDTATLFSLQNDTLRSGPNTWDLLGKSLVPPAPDLKKLTAYQEFWHSWMTFQPATTRY